MPTDNPGLLPLGSIFRHIGKHVAIGLITVIPVIVTWLLIAFIFDKLAAFGLPVARNFLDFLQQQSPLFAELLAISWLRKTIALIFVVALLYLLGWFASRVIGRRLVSTLEGFLLKIPLVRSIYGPVKQLVGVMEKKSPDAQRVVLIDFPSPEMKTVGLATRTMVDESTGQTLVAVYVPTTPNPTSGYLEIVPADKVIATDWTVDEAMKFIVSGGIVGRESINYNDSAGTPGVSKAETDAPD